jgi:hypothetical protein
VHQNKSAFDRSNIDYQVLCPAVYISITCLFNLNIYTTIKKKTKKTFHAWSNVHCLFIFLFQRTYKDIKAHTNNLLASTLLSVLCQHISMKFMTTVLTSTLLSQHISIHFYLFKQNHTNNKRMQDFEKAVSPIIR